MVCMNMVIIGCKNAKLEFLLSCWYKIDHHLTHVDPRIKLSLALLVLHLEVDQELGGVDGLL